MPMTHDELLRAKEAQEGSSNAEYVENRRVCEKLSNAREGTAKPATVATRVPRLCSRKVIAASAERRLQSPAEAVAGGRRTL